MRAHWTLALALLLIASGAALAQTPDWQTPAMETVCDVESGAAFGLCNAYCEAMDCESANPAASATACTKVRTKFQNITGRDLPCEYACPCQAIPEFVAVLNGTNPQCLDIGYGVFLSSDAGIVASTETENPPSGGGCGVFSVGEPIVLNTTPQEGAACNQVLRDACSQVPPV